MIRVHIPAEWIAMIGFMLTLPATWGWMAAHQAGNSTGVALAVTGCVVSLVMMVMGGRRM